MSGQHYCMGVKRGQFSKTMEARLQAAEMWFYRRMLKVSWVGKVSNAEVLRRAGVQQDLVLKIIHRQISFIGHVLRKGQLEEAALTGRIEGKQFLQVRQIGFVTLAPLCHA